MIVPLEDILPPRKARVRKPMECCPECGAILKDEDRERSTPQLRRFFKVVRAAHTNWPESYTAFQPRNVEHLRYWLEHKVGYSDPIKTINCKTTDPAVLYDVLRAILDSLNDRDRVFVEVEGRRVIVAKARSINYSELPHQDACKLFADVEDFIQAEIGFRLPPKEGKS